MEKQVIVVAGADRSIGCELVKQYLEQGHTVLAGQFLKFWPFLPELKKAYPETLTIIPLDVRSDDSVAAFAAAVKEKTDHIDMLVNAEGVWLDEGVGTILDGRLDFEVMKESFDVNALGPFRVINALWPLVAASEGKRIVTLTSCGNSFNNCTYDEQYAYYMGKVSLHITTILLQKNFAPLGIRMFLYHPGFMLSWISFPPQPDSPYIPLPNLRHKYLPDESARRLITYLEQPERWADIAPTDPVFLNVEGEQMEW